MKYQKRIYTIRCHNIINCTVLWAHNAHAQRALRYDSNTPSTSRVKSPIFHAHQITNKF